MARKRNKSAQNNSRESSRKKTGKFFFRFFLFVFTTLIISLIGLYLYVFITIKGPSTYARDRFVGQAINSSYISFLPSWFLTPEEINTSLNNYLQEVNHE